MTDICNGHCNGKNAFHGFGYTDQPPIDLSRWASIERSRSLATRQVSKLRSEGRNLDVRALQQRRNRGAQVEEAAS